MEMSVDFARIEPLLTKRFPDSKPRIERIPAGLGDRRFYRVALDTADEGTPSSLIARIEPQLESGRWAVPIEPSPFAWLPEPPLEPIRTLLEDAGLPVPRSYLHALDAGIDLIEDVGSKTLADCRGEARRRRYLEAVALIPRMQSIRGDRQIAPAFGRVFGASLIRTKASKVIHWLWPGLLDREASARERRSIVEGFDAIAKLLDSAPRRLSHRDFKAENLHLVAAGSAHAKAVEGDLEGRDVQERLVMIDIQGAFMAPPEYDLVCLLRDLQVDLPESLVEEALESVRSSLPDACTPEETEQRFNAIAVVRLAKDLAHIVDAGRSRGDSRRWHEIPRGLRLLENAIDRLQDSFAPARVLNSVINVLSRDAQTSDIQVSRRGE